VLCDCEHLLAGEFESGEVTVSIKLEILNNGGYLGEEEDHWLIVPIIIAIGTWMIFTDKDFLYPDR
jgi:hypothetical protein